MKDHILVLGGDGYLGWPTAMRLSAMGYEVTVVDNYLRRDLCSDLDIDFLYPVPALAERTDLWLKISGKKIHYAELDLSLPDNMRSLFIPGEYEKYRVKMARKTMRSHPLCRTAIGAIFPSGLSLHRSYNCQ